MNVGIERGIQTSAQGGPPSPPLDDLAATLSRELQGLRRGAGLTLGRLASAPALLDVAKAVGYPGGDPVFVADELLRSELANLGEGLGAKALRAALGVGLDDPKTLTQRRHDFAERFERHPDTVESHENRAIHELALRLAVRVRASGAAFPEAGADEGGYFRQLAAHAQLGDSARLVLGHREMLERLHFVVREAEECLVATGSRSRDQGYLTAIEDRLASSALVHYRVLCGPPHWPVLRDHLLRLHHLRTEQAGGGDPRILIGLFRDFRRGPEQFICANERRAVIVLPSLNGLERYDTGLELIGEPFGTAYVRLVHELYAASEPVESEAAIQALPLLRG